jgi:hypothetical protein
LGLDVFLFVGSATIAYKEHIYEVLSLVASISQLVVNVFLDLKKPNLKLRNKLKYPIYRTVFLFGRSLAR